MTDRTLDTMLDAYVECALWSSDDQTDDQGGEPLDANYGADDLAPEALAQMRADCADFLTLLDREHIDRTIGSRPIPRAGYGRVRKPRHRKPIGGMPT